MAVWQTVSAGRVDEVSVHNRALCWRQFVAFILRANAGSAAAVTSFIINFSHGQTVVAGHTAAFSVQAAGLGPLSYQWQFGTNTLNGATNSSISLNNVQAANAGYYSVTVTSPYGPVVSSNALLTVTPDVCSPPASGLVGWWRAESNANDSVGGNNGTLYGNVSYASGKVGQAFVFGGSGSYVGLNNTAALQLQDFSIEAWVQRGTLNPPADQCIFGYGDLGYVFALQSDGTPVLSKVDVDDAVSVSGLFHH